MRIGPEHVGKKVRLPHLDFTLEVLAVGKRYLFSKNQDGEEGLYDSERDDWELVPDEPKPKLPSERIKEILGDSLDTWGGVVDYLDETIPQLEERVRRLEEKA